MKCITIKQPWATLLVIGAKQYETRGWATQHRGPIAIHVSLEFHRHARELCFLPVFEAALREAGYKRPSDLPLGKIIGIANIAGCYRTDDLLISPAEQALGDFRPGRYAWHFTNPQQIAHIPYRGSPGIYGVPRALIRTLTPRAA